MTGRISRIIAFDIDGEEALALFNRAVESLDEELKTALKETMRIRTASGNTNVVIGFRIEEFTSTDDYKLLASPVLWTNGKHSEIRVKGEGGYIVAPPSILEDGKRYELIDGKTAVVILSKAQIQKLISAIQKQTQSPATSIGASNTDLTEEDVSNIVAILKPYYQHGNRNDFTMYLSGWNSDKTTGDISSTGDILSPANKIHPVENGQNHAQNPATGDTGGIGDILHTLDMGFELKPVDGNAKLHDISIYDCYYCTFKTNIQKDYQKHVIFTHPEKPCYPSKADLEKLGLKAQGQSWEI